MSQPFSGEPLTRWIGPRLMELEEPISYTDPDDKLWQVPAGASLNGATIPEALWSSVGSPFVGPYRRASIIHDYFVGEGNNPDVTDEQRKAADRMFYHACIDDGCSTSLAWTLYLGVRVGSWSAWWSGSPKMSTWAEYASTPAPPADEVTRPHMDDAAFREIFQTMIDDGVGAIGPGDFDAAEDLLKKHFGDNQ